MGQVPLSLPGDDLPVSPVGVPWQNAFNQGNFLRRLKRIPEAEHTYRRALAAEPSDQQGLGTVLHEAGRAHEAVTLYLTAQQLQRQRGERSVELERDLSSAMREAGALRGGTSATALLPAPRK